MSKQLVTITRELSRGVEALSFSEPVAYVYNPLEYAWKSHKSYLEKYGDGTGRVLLIGMNPGPWGMVQTGVPFGEVSAVRDWMKIEVPIGKPNPEHPKRPVQGFACERSEVSGRRLWGLFAERFESPKAFFSEHFVVNYCPLAFMEDNARNLTPDKLPLSEVKPLQVACDLYLQRIAEALRPEWVIGVGAYAEKRARMALGEGFRHGRILHPSPASPAANAGWAERAATQLKELGAWS